MNRRQNPRALALSGVMLAVTLLLNYLASLHLIRLDAIFYLLSGALVYVMTWRLGLRRGIAFYAATAILSFALVPDKVWLMLFLGVFGPCAVISAALARAEANERIRRVPAAILSILIFIIMFSVFAFFLVYGGGFIAYLGLPPGNSPAGPVLVVAFGVFSAIIAYVVNRGLTDLIERRLGRTGKTKRKRANETARHIDLPKLYREEEEKE
jgi:hypothetical protein